MKYWVDKRKKMLMNGDKLFMAVTFTAKNMYWVSDIPADELEKLEIPESLFEICSVNPEYCSIFIGDKPFDLASARTPASPPTDDSRCGPVAMFSVGGVFKHGGELHIVQVWNHIKGVSFRFLFTDEKGSMIKGNDYPTYGGALNEGINSIAYRVRLDARKKSGKTRLQERQLRTIAEDKLMVHQEDRQG